MEKVVLPTGLVHQQYSDVNLPKEEVDGSRAIARLPLYTASVHRRSEAPYAQLVS